MTAKDLTLNIAVNLGRIAKFAQEGRKNRVDQFLNETETYLELLEKAKKHPRFKKTYDSFQKKFYDLKNNIELNDKWAEETLTWASILTHRAKLAD